MQLAKNAPGIVLLGLPYSKRTKYFLQAAGDLPVTVMPLDIGASPQALSVPENSIVKIDPPELGSASLADLTPCMDRYRAFLATAPGAKFLNSGEAILQTLDKHACKKALERAGLPVTPLLEPSDSQDTGFRSIHELREYMQAHKITAVFIKPRYGSGATGVIAFRRNPKTGEEAAYTSLLARNGKFYNTKKVRRITGVDECGAIAGAVLEQGAVVEKWIPKASHNGKAVDLRIVFQFGRIAFMIARQSSGPITNLHLCNGALPVSELGLKEKLLAEIEELCRRAVSLFPGLESAGIDILLEKDSLCPRIIEVNGQGDLIHQDIYGANSIYREQIQYLYGLQNDNMDTRAFFKTSVLKKALLKTQFCRPKAEKLQEQFQNQPGFEIAQG